MTPSVSPRVRRAALRGALALTATCLAAVPSLADEIRLMSGKPKKNVTIVNETFSEVSFKQGDVRATQTVDASDVKEVIHSQTSNEYQLAQERMSAGDFEQAATFFKAAAVDPPRNRKWLTQYALFNAAECYRFAQQFDKAAAAYDAVLEKVPDTRFFGDVYLRKAQCFEAKGDSAKAKSTYEALATDARAKNVGQRWELRSEYELLRLGNASLADFESLQSKAAGAGFSDVANLARLGVGYALIQQNKLEEARAYFKNIIDERQASPVGVVAGAYNGYGTTFVQKDNPTQDDWNEAMYAFLRTVYHYGDQLGKNEMVAEALYWAGRCFEARTDNPEVYGRRARVMFTRCVKEYEGTTWADKAAAR